MGQVETQRRVEFKAKVGEGQLWRHCLEETRPKRGGVEGQMEVQVDVEGSERVGVGHCVTHFLETSSA